MSKKELAIATNLEAEKRRGKVPADFEIAMAGNKAAKAVWDEFSDSHKKEYLTWIENAKKEETRRRRIERAISMIAKKG